MRAVDVLGRKQLPVCDVFVAGFELRHLANVAELLRDERAVRIALAVDQGEDRVALFPTIFACKPTWRSEVTLAHGY